MTEKMGFEKNKKITREYNSQKITAKVGGKLCHFRSKFEYHWAQYLEILKQSNEIADWEYEPKTFYFENVKTAPVQYKPDFKVICHDGSHFWQETKGEHDGKTNKKLQRMHQQYPDEIFELVLQHIPKNGIKGANRRQVAQRYARRVFDGTQVLKQLGGMIRKEPPIVR